MRLVNVYRNTLLRAGLLGLVIFASGPSQAITLNFAAELIEGTCQISLSPSNLVLNPVSVSELIPSTLLAVQPFTLHVDECTPGNADQTPGVEITGAGTESASGKWFFRDGSSTAGGVGIMLVRPGDDPIYSANEVRQNDIIELASLGTTPETQDLTFHVGMACTDAACSGKSAGAVAATILFTFDYR